MLLNKLLNECRYEKVTGNVDVSGIEYDSRKVDDGDLFFCINGYSQDGHKYIKEACAAGAAAIVLENTQELPTVPFIKVKNARKTMAKVSNLFFGRPSSRLKLIGISGTNGKTTTSYIIESIYEAAGIPTGVVGTINYRFGNMNFEAKRTTPESPDLNRFLSSISDAKACVLEVSSHAVSLSRVEYLEFDTAIFTNLTPEHLDFHKTFENYRDTKKSFFTGIGRRGNVIVNIDDSLGKTIAIEAKASVITYGLSKADVTAEDLQVKRDGIFFTAVTPDSSFLVKSPMTGLHNVYNILASIAAAWADKIPTDSIKKGVASLENVPGRLEKVPCKEGFDVFIDYAHTDDALEKLLRSVKALNGERIITVFGCGGNRDRGKRARMGKVAAELSDYIILTSDNPRDENPMAIIEEIVEGIKKGEKIPPFQTIEDRKEAIVYAVNNAEDGDIVLVVGKGHETTQEENGTLKPFSDMETVRDALKG